MTKEEKKVIERVCSFLVALQWETQLPEYIKERLEKETEQLKRILEW